mgnify:CR=1 FL=1
MIDKQLIAMALTEDLQGGEDVTSVSTIAADSVSCADFTSRAAGVLAGIEMVKAVLEEVGLTDIEVKKSDGEPIAAGDVLLTVTGNTRAILLAERTALNFVGHLSGIATQTAKWVAAVAGTMYLMYYGVASFHDGFIPGVKAFTAAVLGGIGSLPGAVLGGLLIGLIETFFSGYFSLAYKDVAAFSILAIVLIFMPQGILGRPEVEKV